MLGVEEGFGQSRVRMRKIWCSVKPAITIVISIFGISLPVVSTAETFRCRVVDQIVLATDQGRSSRYSSFVDGINVGDSLSVELGTGYAKLNGENSRTGRVSLRVTRGNGNEALSFLSLLSRADIFGDQIVFNGGRWLPDEITVGSLGNVFEIRRNYMTDWHGLFTTIESGQAYLAVINCLGADGPIQKARREFIENPDIDFRILPDISDIDFVD
jgi:hypothetical protein